MKKNFLKIFAAVLAVFLTGCLDDKEYALDPSGSDNIIEFLDPSVISSPVGSVYPLWTTTTEIQPDFTFEQVISYSGPNGNNKDIQVTVAVDPVALAEYNAQRLEEDGNASGTYNLMPPNYYTFPDLTVTIPKGQTKVTIPIKVHPNQFDLTKSFALPLRIVSASSGILSQHFSVAIMAVVVKNKYDGVYKVISGSVTRLVSGVPDLVLGGPYKDDLEMEFATVNGVTNSFSAIWADGSPVGGIDGTRITINDAVTNPDGSNPLVVSSTTNGTLVNYVGEENKYWGTPPVTADNPDQDPRIYLSFTWSTAGTREIRNLIVQFDRPRQ